MKYVGIKDSKGKELVKNEVTADIPQDLLEAAAELTCFSHNMEFPDDPWEPIKPEPEVKENPQDTKENKEKLDKD